MNFKHLRYFWLVARTGSIARASEQLHLTPQTLSGQINLLEEQLEESLFVKRGRSLELTDAGRLAYRYAQDIFSLGSELEESLRGFKAGGRPVEFRVGIADSVSKTIAYWLIEPATGIGGPVHLVCREGALDEFMADLGAHRLDLVIAGEPVPPSARVRAYNHGLGTSAVSFFSAPGLRKALRGKFPACLDGAPTLVPTADSAVRRRLDQWFETNNVRPRILGEFDDTALMKAFGQRGAGVFTGPSVLESEIERQYGVKVIGRAMQVVEEYFAISVERRLTHPCVVAISQAARSQLL